MLMEPRRDEPRLIRADHVELLLTATGWGRRTTSVTTMTFQNREVPLFVTDDLRLGQSIIGRTQPLRWERFRGRRVVVSTRVGCGHVFASVRCGDLRVGSPAYFSNVDTDVVSDGTQWIQQHQQPLKLFTRPGGVSRVSALNVALERVAERGEWTDLVGRFPDVVVRGWARTTYLRRARGSRCEDPDAGLPSY